MKYGDGVQYAMCCALVTSLEADSYTLKDVFLFRMFSVKIKKRLIEQSLFYGLHHKMPRLNPLL